MPKSFMTFLAFCRDQRGSPAVEFALVAPILILLTVGILDIGRVMMTATTLESVARDAARYAGLHGSDSTTPATQSSVQSYAEGQAVGIDSTTLNVAVTWEGGSNSSGSSVTVALTYDFDLLVGQFLGFDAITLDSASSMTIL